MANDEPDLEPRSASAFLSTATARRALTPYSKENREDTGLILSRFHQQDGIRHYIFEHPNDSDTSTEATVYADVRLLRKYGIVFQELLLVCRHLLEQQNVGAPVRAVTFRQELMKEQADHPAALKPPLKKRKAYHGSRPGSR